MVQRKSVYVLSLVECVWLARCYFSLWKLLMESKGSVETHISTVV